MATVLIIDDDLQLLGAMKRLLGTMSIPVEAVKDAEAALKWLDGGGTPDVVIADEHLPGITGRELLETVARRLPESARILHTADDALAAESVEPGFAVLLKPVAPPLLRQVISRFLARRHLMPDPW